MKSFIKRHYLSSFYITTFIFSFFLLTLHFVFKTVGNYSVSFTQLAPTFAVVFIAFVLKDKRILYEIKSRLSLQGSSVKWLIPSMILPAICIVTISLVMTLLKIKYIPWSGNALFYILNIVAIMIGCTAEEIGWRGFLLPGLQEKHSLFISSIIVGFLWGIWHLNFTGGILGFILYTITIIEMSILMAWIFSKTKGSLLPMILWHFVFNLLSHVLLWERFNIHLFIVESIVFGIVCLVIVLSNTKVFLNKSKLN